MKLVPRLGLTGLLTVAGLLAASPARAGVATWYTEIDNAFDPQPCTPSGCWTNYLRMTDLDGDDDLDVVFVNYEGFFGAVPEEAEPLVIYQNDGSASFTNVSTDAVDDHMGRIRQVAIGDVDGDGDPDMYVPSAQAEGDAFFINDGSGVFTDEVGTLLPGLDSRAGAARFADFDNDGDLDLFLSDGYMTNNATGHVYLNDGMGMFEELDNAVGAAQGEDIDDVDIFDADRDFDLDIMVNAHTGDNTLWLNDGSGMFTDASDGLPGQDNTYHYNPAICDVDGDGDLDIWIDNMGPNYSEQLLINAGDGTFADETATRVTGNPGADDNGVMCADVDNDGDFDAVVWSLQSSGERFLDNDGNGEFTHTGGVFPSLVDGTLWGDMGDLDGDGRIDAVTGQGETSSANRAYRATDAIPVDDRAPVIITTEAAPNMVAADEGVVLRYAVSDRVVTDEGPRLSAAFARVTVGGDSQDVPATFMGGDLFRADIPGQADGATVEVEFCATDRAGNEACSDVQTYDVGESSGTSGTSGTGGPTTGDSDSGETSDSNSGTGGATMTNTATASDTANTATDGTDGGGDTDTDTAGAGGGGDDGCGCRSSGGSDPAALWLLAGVGLLGLRRRRR